MRTLVGPMAVVVALTAGACTEDGWNPTMPRVEPPTTATAPEPPKGEHALVAFSSCESLLEHVKREALRIVTPYGLQSPGAAFTTGRRLRAFAVDTAEARTGSAPAMGAGAADASDAGGPGFSGTNIQEEGVDEPDLVKSDGRRLVTVAKGRLTVADLTGPQPRQAGTLALPSEESGFELLLAGDRVVVLGQSWRAVGGGRRPLADDVVASDMIGGYGNSVVRVVDIADPPSPRIVATMTLEGQYVSARLASGVVRLVVQNDPKGPSMPQPVRRIDEDRLLAENKAAIERSGVRDWLPTYTLERPGQDKVTEPLAPCTAVLRPKEFAGLSTVSVLTIDPADPKPAVPACVLGAGRIVYAGLRNLYVASERWADPAGDQSPTASIAVADTELHQFAIVGREPAAYVASGRVAGSVLNQFSMSEHDGRVRVAATKRQVDGSTESLVYVLEAREGKLVTVGRLGNLGHEGETIHSVRFIGTRGYVVTFRQTDPLYVVDLADPTKPQLRCELEVPGFSSYLHPVSDSVLLGVGTGPTADGARQGLQLSLFDVADPTRPRRLDVEVFPNAHSLAQGDHHAFLWWAPTRQLVLPLTEYEDRSEPFQGAVVVGVDPAAGFGRVDRIDHAARARADDSPIHRSMMLGTRLLTLSEGGLMARDATTLVEQSWLAW